MRLAGYMVVSYRCFLGSFTKTDRIWARLARDVSVSGSVRSADTLFKNCLQPLVITTASIFAGTHAALFTNHPFTENPTLTMICSNRIRFG